LAGRYVEDTVLRGPGVERCAWVLALDDGEDGLDVQRVEGAGCCQRGLFVAYVEGAIDEPDVSFDGDAAYTEGGVEGNVAPVVVVGVDWFLGEVLVL